MEVPLPVKATLTECKGGRSVLIDLYGREETYVPKVLYSEGPMFRTFVKMLGT